MPEIKAGKPTGEILYLFTPNITFNHKDDFGNIMSGYEKDMKYQVRRGNDKLNKVVMGWLQKDALDEDGNVIPISDSPDDGNLKLVRMGG